MTWASATTCGEERDMSRSPSSVVCKFVVLLWRAYVAYILKNPIDCFGCTYGLLLGETRCNISTRAHRGIYRTTSLT